MVLQLLNSLTCTVLEVASPFSLQSTLGLFNSLMIYNEKHHKKLKPGQLKIKITPLQFLKQINFNCLFLKKRDCASTVWTTFHTKLGKHFSTQKCGFQKNSKLLPCNNKAIQLFFHVKAREIFKCTRSFLFHLYFVEPFLLVLVHF